MTTLRFVGEIPLWLGLLLSLIVCAPSWRYYGRESFELPRRLKWFLPLLRSLAFFLGIMVLTGPVLHHRTIIGELGRVRIYLDASRSMTMQDRHMSVGRKLMIAEQLGWITAGHVDSTLLKTTDELSDARREFREEMAIAPGGRGSRRAATEQASTAESVSTTETAQQELRPPEEIDLAKIRVAAGKFRTRLQELHAQLPTAIGEQLSTELLQPLEVAIAAIEGTPDAAVSQLTTLTSAGESTDAALRKAFDDSIADVVNSDESIRSALAMFDETPRWRRAELGLSESSAKILSALRETHDVEVLTLTGEEAVGQASSLASSDPTNATPANGNFSNITDLSTGIVATQNGHRPAD